MILLDLLQTRKHWGEDEVIYVAQPWRWDAEAIFISKAPTSTDPIFRDGNQYDYFLEGFLICEVLDDCSVSTAKISKDDCDKVIYYATHDAFMP